MYVSKKKSIPNQIRINHESNMKQNQEEKCYHYVS